MGHPSQYIIHVLYNNYYVIYYIVGKFGKHLFGESALD